MFYNGGDNFAPNKTLSLIMYYTAYTKGLVDLKDKVSKVRKELVDEGEPLPEMVKI